MFMYVFAFVRVCYVRSNTSDSSMLENERVQNTRPKCCLLTTPNPKRFFLKPQQAPLIRLGYLLK